MEPDVQAEPAGERAHSGEWECMECGYVEQGVMPKRPKVCPDCGAPAQALEFFPSGDDEPAWHAVQVDDDEDFEDEELG